MMVMRRRAGESIAIGENIRVLVADVGRNRVKLVIDAPREIVISARDITAAEAENRAAAKVEGGDAVALARALREVSKNISNAQPPLR